MTTEKTLDWEEAYRLAADANDVAFGLLEDWHSTALSVKANGVWLDGVDPALFCVTSDWATPAVSIDGVTVKCVAVPPEVTT
jgi:hypothetical protein